MSDDKMRTVYVDAEAVTKGGGGAAGGGGGGGEGYVTIEYVSSLEAAVLKALGAERGGNFSINIEDVRKAIAIIQSWPAA